MLSSFHSLALLPDLGGGEMMLILLVVLLLFGGDKMPQMAKSLGKSLRQFKKAAAEVEQEIKRAIDEVPDVPDLRATVREAVEDKPKRLVPTSGPVGAPPAVATPANPPAVAPATPTSPAAPQPPPVG
jgi:sec-independent protein translocase protein TatA